MLKVFSQYTGNMECPNGCGYQMNVVANSIVNERVDFASGKTPNGGWIGLMQNNKYIAIEQHWCYPPVATPKPKEKLKDRVARLEEILGV